MRTFEYLRIVVLREEPEKNFEVFTVTTDAKDMDYEAMEDQVIVGVEFENRLGTSGWELASSCPLEIEIGDGVYFVTEIEKTYKRAKE